MEFSTINKDNKAQNNRIAYTKLTEELGIPAIFEFSDLIESKTSERALMFFVGHCINVLQSEKASEGQSSEMIGSELNHIKNSVLIMEKRLDTLSSTAQRLSSGIELVLSSSNAAESTSFQTSLMKDQELQNHVINLELKIGKLMAFIHAQDAQIDELIKKQNNFDDIINFNSPHEDELDEETIRINYPKLVQQNNYLRNCNDMLSEQNKLLQAEAFLRNSQPSDSNQNTKRTKSSTNENTNSTPSSNNSSSSNSSTSSNTKRKETTGQKKKKKPTGTLRRKTAIQDFISRTSKRKSNCPDDAEEMSPIVISNNTTPKTEKRIVSPRQLVHSESTQEIRRTTYNRDGSLHGSSSSIDTDKKHFIESQPKVSFKSFELSEDSLLDDPLDDHDSSKKRASREIEFT